MNTMSINNMIYHVSKLSNQCITSNFNMKSSQQSQKRKHLQGRILHKLCQSTKSHWIHQSSQSNKDKISSTVRPHRFQSNQTVAVVNQSNHQIINQHLYSSRNCALISNKDHQFLSFKRAIPTKSGLIYQMSTLINWWCQLLTIHNSFIKMQDVTTLMKIQLCRLGSTSLRLHSSKLRWRYWTFRSTISKRIAEIRITWSNSRTC